jgi:murein DD-endopeptidase MepM/ murein hydrolase activator NlpD
MTTLRTPVGLQGVNDPQDTRTIQHLLHQNRHLIPDGREIPVDGIIGPKTIAAIRRFQIEVLKLQRPDGRVDPKGRTLQALIAGTRTTAPAHRDPATPPTVAARLARPIRFPLRARPTASYKFGHGHHRYFGAGRTTKTGGYRAHAACDLLAPPGTEILAIEDGTIARSVYYFYEGTNALEVSHDNGLVVRYGEISRAATGLTTGEPVKRGQVLVYVGRLNSGSSMLHFEAYAGTKKGELSTPGNVFVRRGDLVDPTTYLDQATLD